MADDGITTPQEFVKLLANARTACIKDLETGDIPKDRDGESEFKYLFRWLGSQGKGLPIKPSHQTLWPTKRFLNVVVLFFGSRRNVWKTR